MIFPLGDQIYVNDDPIPSPSLPSDNLDSQLDSLKLELKTLEREIQIQRTAHQLNDESSTERKQQEIADLNRQISSFQRALDYEHKRAQHFQTEIARHEGRLTEQQQILASQPDSEYFDEQAASFKSQNDQLSQELRDLHRDIANEVGDDFNIDEILQSGGNERKRAEELQHLQGEVAKLQSQAVTSRIQQSLDRAACKAVQGVDQLLTQKAELEVAIDTLRNQITRIRTKLDSLEEANRALRLMDVLLNEKLQHDADLIQHLEEFQNGNPETYVLPEEEIPEVTIAIVEQLRMQQVIIKGLFYKLAMAQRELIGYTVPESFEFLVEQLDALNKRCLFLQKSLMQREAAETEKIEAHLGEE
jgi:chromosome segregation ATPase